MANVIKIKRSNTASAVPSLVYGELAINVNDEIMYYGNASNAATDITGLMSDATLDTAATVVKGVASFDADMFSVSSGNVSIAAGGIGSAEIENGSVNTDELAAGAVTEAKIGTGAVTNLKIGNDAVTLGTQTTGNYVAGISGTAAKGITVSGSGSENATVTISADDASYTGKGVIQVSSSKFQVLSGVLSNIASGSIANDRLENDSVTIGSTEVALGNTITSLDGLTDINLTSGNKTIFDGVGSNTLTIGAGGTTVNIAGNLTVTGTTTTVNSTTVTIDDRVLTLGGDTAPTSDPAVDYGIEFRYWDITTNQPVTGEAVMGFMGYDDSAESFVMLKEVTDTSGQYSGTYGPLKVGDIYATAFRASGSSATCHDLQIDCGTFS